MTTIKVDTITNAAGSGAPNIPDGVTIGGTALASINSMDYTASGTEPTSPKNGAIWWDTGNSKFFQYMNGAWVEVSYTTKFPDPFFGNTAVFGGGFNNYYFGSQQASLQAYNISTGGFASGFGSLTIEAYELAACSNSSRGLFGGGSTPTLENNIIGYVTFATAGNATDFGDLSVARQGLASCSNSVTGLFGGGYNGSSNDTTIDYVTIATTGNAQDFGDLSVARTLLGACSNGVYGVFGGGTGSNVLDYVSIDTAGNATDFGDLTVSGFSAACSDYTYGVYSGVSFANNVIEYIAIATPSNATDFGDLTVARGSLAACSNGTRGLFGGGDNGFSETLTIDYVTIATPGNATDFGDLSEFGGTISPGACSGN